MDLLDQMLYMLFGFFPVLVWDSLLCFLGSETLSSQHAELSSSMRNIK